MYSKICLFVSMSMSELAYMPVKSGPGIPLFLLL